ncbi:MAG: endonuclease/exonuclease/phosphatase family protein, partial [Yoonia sp.]
MLRDLEKGDDAELAAAQAVIAHIDPDVLLLTDFDYDYDSMALQRLAMLLDYPHYFAARPNTGVQTSLDLDGNGWFGEARDAQGYG